MNLTEVETSIAKHEDFKAEPYIDPLVAKNPEEHGITQDEFAIIKSKFNQLKVTIGYGFTNLTKEEADAILKLRTQQIYDILADKINGFDTLHEVVQNVFVEMAFQMGWPTLLKFKQTIKYAFEGNYEKVAEEMLDSRWARQTYSRAKELSDKIKNI